MAVTFFMKSAWVELGAVILKPTGLAAALSAPQALHFAEALPKGTREREKLMKEAFKHKVRELV